MSQTGFKALRFISRPRRLNCLVYRFLTFWNESLEANDAWLHYSIAEGCFVGG